MRKAGFGSLTFASGRTTSGASLTGFRDVTRNVTVSAGSAFEMPFVLPLATIEETIMIVRPRRR